MANLKDIIDYTAGINSVSKAAASEILKDAFAFIKDELASGGEVTIDKFGKFVPQHRAERQGRNPKTGEPITVEATTVVKFKPAKDFKDLVAD